MIGKRVLKIIFVFIGVNILVYGNNLDELRLILGDEELIIKEKSIKNNEKLMDNLNNLSEKEISSTSNISYNFLLEAPIDYYTINIATLNKNEDIKNYLNKNDFDISGVYNYSFGVNRENIKIIYGVFKSIDEAKDAMNKLPKSIIEKKPYIDNIKKHQKLFLKYN